MLFIANTVTRNRYLQTKQFLKVTDSRNRVEGSEIAKIKPLYDAFNMALKQFGILHDLISIYQTMLPHKGLHSIDEFTKSKPIKFG